MTLFRTFVFDCDLSDFEPDSLVFENGASDGLNFEPGVNDIVKFAHLCLHDEETIEQVKEFLINCNNS